jgi:hypothetical protein
LEPNRVTSAFGGTAVEQRGTRVVVSNPRLLPPPWRRWLVITDGYHTANISLAGHQTEIEDALRNAGFGIALHQSWVSVSRGIAPQRPRRVLPSLPEVLDGLTGFSKSSTGLVLAILAGLLLVGGMLLFPTTEGRISQAATVGCLLAGTLLGVLTALGSKRANAIAQWSGLFAVAAAGIVILSSPDMGWRVFNVAVVVIWTGSGVSVVIYAARRLRRRAGRG